MGFILIYITHAGEPHADRIVKHLLSKKLIACANIFPISSAYWWKGGVEQEGEWVSLVKTTRELWDEVRREVEKEHPYDVPCIMKLEATANDAYENWIRRSVRNPETSSTSS